MQILIKSLIITLLLLGAYSKSASQRRPAVLDVKSVQLERNSSKSFILKNLDEGKALMVSPQFSFKAEKYRQLEVRITNQENSKVQCLFKYNNNICVIERSTKEATITFTCLEEQCQGDFVFSQRTVVSVEAKGAFRRRLMVPGEIYKLEKRRYNTILQVYAERQEHDILSDQIVVFSNIHAFPLHQVQELDTNSAIFGLKPIKKDTEQYIYIDNRSNNNEMLKASLKTHNGELRDGISIIDFIENYGKHSHNNYTYPITFRKNLQVNVRVFSPREPKGIPLTLKIKGKIKEEEDGKEITSIKLDPIEFKQQKYFDFTFAVTKALHKGYKFVSFELMLHQVQDKSVFFQLSVRDLDTFEIDIFQSIYFASESSQTLHFAVQSQINLELCDGDRLISLLTNPKEGYSTTTSNCSLHKGCQIDITTKQSCQNCSFLFDLNDQNIKNHIVYYQVKEGIIEGKVDIEEQLYFKYVMDEKENTEIVVNTLNVMIYAIFENYQRCSKPTASCHQYAINQENPIIIHNNEQQPVKLIVGIVGLEKTPFVARFLNKKNGLQVKLGEKFSYLMDNQDKTLELKFLINREQFGKKQHLHFNLISPLHSLRLTVSNEDGQVLQSLQGYISFDKQNIRGDLFTITIEKINQYYGEYVHFTLVVNTNDAALRLDSNTHYEKYGPKEARIFLIEYDPSEANAINIYTENMEKERASMSISLRNTKQAAGTSINSYNRKLVRNYEFIDIEEWLEKLDICDDTNCELQLTIQNEGNVELQQALTLISEDSLVGLVDSIWTTFQINELSIKNHFYFIPRNQNKSITILFNTDDSLLYINYRIFNTVNSINPQDWPFSHQKTQDGRGSNSQEIVIEGNDPQLSRCWPTCVVLININQVGEQKLSQGLQHSVIKSYKLLSTNSIIELPQDTKLQFTLKNEQEKVLFIMVQNILKYEKLTFFTYYALGRAKITASIVSNNVQYKLNNSKPFFFEDLETSLPVSLISQIIAKQTLIPESVLLKITISAITNLKMTLEYSSLLKDIYRLRMDDLEVTSLKRGEQIWYELLPERDFVMKLYRIKGFPLFKVIKCDEENYIQCLKKSRETIELRKKEFLNTQETIKANLEKATIQTPKSEQMQVFIQKSYEFNGDQCQKCIYFLWVYCFEGDLQLTINIRSRMSEIELKEMAVVNERLDFGEHNKYLLNVLHNKDTVITVRMIEGAAQVQVTDSSNSLFNEILNSDDKNYKEFLINADEDEDDEEQSEEEQEKQNFGRVRKSNKKHLFKHIHVAINGVAEKQSAYMISYSMGQSSLYLEDGVVVQKNTVPQIPHTFFYRNHNKKEHAYLTISSQILPDYSFLNNSNSVSIKFYYYPDASNRAVKQLFQPELPPQRNQNYLGSVSTNVYQLPVKYELYEIIIVTSSYLKVTASINHQQLVYLPLDFDYLIKLHPRESLNLAVNSPTTEYLKITISKCDLSAPSLQYTNDARQFKKGIFEGYVDIDQNNFKQYIKTKKGSKTIHLKLIGDSENDSLMKVFVESSTKQKRASGSNFKAGDKGSINYRVLEGSNVEISFKPITCAKKTCNLSFTYYLLVSEDIEEVYGQLNCAGSYFIPQVQKEEKSEAKIIMLDAKDYDQKRGEYVRKIKVQGSQAFIGVKGISQESSEEVLYSPITVESLWGEFTKISSGIIMMVVFALLTVLGLIIIVSTKLARSGYKPINSQQ